MESAACTLPDLIQTFDIEDYTTLHQPECRKHQDG